jgi:hypothetical protein
MIAGGRKSAFEKVVSTHIDITKQNLVAPNKIILQTGNAEIVVYCVN